MESEAPWTWAENELGATRITARRVRPWASVWRLEAASEVWWLKTNSAETGYEPRLLQLLNQLGSPLVPLTRVHSDQPWALVSDAGRSARDAFAAGSADRSAILGFWCELLPRYAELQQQFPVDAGRAAGLPDATPDQLPEMLEALLAERVWLAPEFAPELTTADRARIAACRPLLVDAARALADSTPSSVQHDDLHSGNVFLDAGTGRASIIDWGDASLAHPFGTLLVTLRSLAADLRLTVDDPALRRVQSAYLEPWRTGGESGAELNRQVDLASRTGGLVRAASWRRALGCPEAGRELGFSGSVAGWLLHLAEALDGSS